MKITISIFLLLLFTNSCNEQLYLRNITEPVGYAMGENIDLRFASNTEKGAADSIEVFVLETKTGYLHDIWAKRAGCDSVCQYSTIWNGCKSDGRWPVGGAYLVYARMTDHQSVYSDTVQIGLGDL
jgi:hypothetical protein